ncbi:MAG: S24/S26 family peptidase [Clostridia bacterium]|nr:S24/S26 family peptidase [Clostridia bacterium]
MIDNRLETNLEKDGYIVTPIKGASMHPFLNEGRDNVVIKKVENKISKGDVILYVRPNGTYVLHRVYNVTPKFLETCGDNQTIVERGVKYSAVLGVLDGVYRNNKYINLKKSLRYKFYKIFWGNNRSFRIFVIKLKKLAKKILKKN